jgi:hypothetical protein
MTSGPARAPFAPRSSRTSHARRRLAASTVRRGIEAWGWADEELSQVGNPTIDVAADVVGVMAFDVGGCHDMTSEDPRREAGGESLDLRLDPLAHVDRRSVGDMAIGPTDMLAGRCARRVGHRGLSEDHERPLGHLARGHRVLGCDHFIEGASNVHRARPPACLRAPGDWAVERPVDLEHARTITKPL